ncbi:S-adenosyl-L-methionine-dependent methyltransferase [Apodospora peruviana]|uniref:S-adenosyl-L-methionine-dependent methyltransferase n=1 Tax=Apodospora peruviana TaxID=516989 RepID=A0AAE0IV52_9PEZI|nr:S-adenosyl-L-methionine-dependent methyltransferase [Apodospora peruviana]
MASHTHQHHHNHQSHTHQNKEFFNNEAAAYDAKHEKTLGHIVDEIRTRLDFIGLDWVDDDDDSGDSENKKSPAKAVRLLDYACGTGVVSRALAPSTTQCVGIDLSENMVAAYNARAENQGLTKEEMYAYQGNLCVSDDPNPPAFSSPDFFNFDIAAVGLGFHHFDDPELAAKRLVERLGPGGVLVILDFLPHEKMETGHAASHTVTHHGFSREHIQKIFTDAGAGKDFALDELSRDVMFNRGMENGQPEMRRRIFIARGTKA